MNDVAGKVSTILSRADETLLYCSSEHDNAAGTQYTINFGELWESLATPGKSQRKIILRHDVDVPDA